MSTYNTSNYTEQGGSRDVVGGSLDVISGGEMDIESGGSFKRAGTAVASSAAELDQRVITAEIQNIAAGGQTYICSPFAGDVAKVYSVLEGAIANVNETLTVKDKAGNSMGTITIAYSGSGGGDVDSLEPSSNQDVAAGDMIEIESAGDCTNDVDVNLFVVIQIT